MTRYLAGVLSVIAVGVLLIAYGLLNPRAPAFASRANLDPYAGPLLAGERLPPPDDPYAAYTYAERYRYLNGYGPAYPPPPEYRTVQAVRTSQVARPVSAHRTVQAAPRRDWKKTALLIGGSTAAGAGLGGIIGGQKGALIGAALAGGASTIYETTKR